jgi:hypothetical protein
MNLEKCKTANWEVFGLEDADRGIKQRYSYWQDSCLEYGITPDQQKYLLGYQKGIETFCTFQKGYLLGNDGIPLPQICPLDRQETFTRGYIEGKRSYDSKTLMEKEIKVQEQAHEDEIKYRERVWNTIQGATCNQNEDCKVSDRCNRDNRCEKSGKNCYYNTDCSLQGNCNHHKCSY